MPILFYGITYHTSAVGKALIVGGILMILGSFVAWGIEPVDEPHYGAPEGEDEAEDEPEDRVEVEVADD